MTKLQAHVDTIGQRAKAESDAKEAARVAKERVDAAHVAAIVDKASDMGEAQKLPQPTGYRLLVMVIPPKNKSAGGIELVEQTMARNTAASKVAYVVKLGPTAYKDAKRFGEGVAWCEEGDVIMIGQYAGSSIGMDGGELRIINDDEVMATVSKQFAMEFVDIK